MMPSTLKKTLLISDSPQGDSENIRTEDKLFLMAKDIDLETKKVRLLINTNLQHYENFRGGQWTAFEITSDTHDLTLTAGDAPQRIAVDGTDYEISVITVSKRLNKGGEHKYAELEIGYGPTNVSFRCEHRLPAARVRLDR